MEESSKLDSGRMSFALGTMVANIDRNPFTVPAGCGRGEPRCPGCPPGLFRMPTMGLIIDSSASPRPRCVVGMNIDGEDDFGN